MVRRCTKTVLVIFAATLQGVVVLDAEIVKVLIQGDTQKIMDAKIGANGCNNSAQRQIRPGRHCLI